VSDISCWGCHAAGRAEGFDAGIVSQREADASLVEAAGCLCFLIEECDLASAAEFSEIYTDSTGGRTRDVVVHDPRCPCALAAKIRGQA
jgi:hypothetical protein